MEDDIYQDIGHWVIDVDGTLTDGGNHFIPGCLLEKEAYVGVLGVDT